MRKIVCVGGGHGLSAALRAARTLTDDVTAIVTVADDGGSSGILREQLKIPAPGDLRMAIAALAGDESREGLIQYRFRDGELAGHPLGNLLIAALADLRGDFADAVSEVAALAGVRGKVIPSTAEPVRLHARIGDLDVEGQVHIARGPGAVDLLTLVPSGAPGHPSAIEAIAAADLVVLGPGSLFTSIIAALLPVGIGEAVAGAGRVAYVLNLSEQIGETRMLDARGHVDALHRHVPGLRLDAVIAHVGAEDGISRPLRRGDAFRAPVIEADVRGEGAGHDPVKLAQVLAGLL